MVLGKGDRLMLGRLGEVMASAVRGFVYLRMVRDRVFLGLPSYPNVALRTLAKKATDPQQRVSGTLRLVS